MPKLERLYALPDRNIADSRKVNLYLLWKHLHPEPNLFKKSFKLPLYSLNALGSSWLTPLSRPSLGVPFKQKQLPIRFNRSLFYKFPWVGFSFEGIVTSKTLNNFADSWVYSYKRYQKATSFSTEQITFQAYAEYAIYCQRMFAKSLLDAYNDTVHYLTPTECVQYNLVEYLESFNISKYEIPSTSDSDFLRLFRSKIINFGMSKTFEYLRESRENTRLKEQFDPEYKSQKPLPEVIRGRLVPHTYKERYDSVDRSTRSHTDHESKEDRLRRLFRENTIHSGLNVRLDNNKWIWRENGRIVDTRNIVLDELFEDKDVVNIEWFKEFLEYLITDENTRQMILRKMRNSRKSPTSKRESLKEFLMKTLIEHYYEASGAYMITKDSTGQYAVNTVKAHLKAQFPQSKKFLDDIFKFNSTVDTLPVQVNFSDCYFDRFKVGENEFLLFYPWEVKELTVKLYGQSHLEIKVDGQVFIDHFNYRNVIAKNMNLVGRVKQIDENIE